MYFNLLIFGLVTNHFPLDWNLLPFKLISKSCAFPEVLTNFTISSFLLTSFAAVAYNSFCPVNGFPSFVIATNPFLYC